TLGCARARPLHSCLGKFSTLMPSKLGSSKAASSRRTPKDKTMKEKKIDAVEVWKEFEDLATRLGLNVIERAVYSHLLRHTRLEGKLRQRFTITGLACKVGISRGPVRESVRRLADHRILRLVDRSYGGHLVEVRLPAEVRAARLKAETGGRSKP